MNLLQLQTTTKDIRAGWRYFRAWKQRFWLSHRRGSLSDRIEDELYLADYNALMRLLALEPLDGVEIAGDEDACNQKIAFMQAYISVLTLESKDFERDVKSILRCQTRRIAAKSFGFWFTENDLEKFGAGISEFFQGRDISLFCDSVEQIDFADLSAIHPFDGIIVRNPDRNWTVRSAKRLTDHIKRDLAFDGIETEIESGAWENLLELSLQTPDYGNDLTPHRIRALRANEVYRELMGHPRRR